MPGTTTRWAMPAAWSILPISSSSGARNVWCPQLCDCDGQLLGFHAHRWRAQDAGASALLSARLYPIHIGLLIPALRDGRRICESRGRLACLALRQLAHAGDWPVASDLRSADAFGPESELECRAVRRLG